MVLRVRAAGYHSMDLFRSGQARPSIVGPFRWARLIGNLRISIMLQIAHGRPLRAIFICVFPNGEVMKIS